MQIDFGTKMRQKLLKNWAKIRRIENKNKDFLKRPNLSNFNL